MTSNGRIQTQLLLLVQNLTAKKERIEKELSQVNGELETLQKTIELLEKMKGVEASDQFEFSDKAEVNVLPSVESLKGKTQLQAIIEIAKRNNNRIKVGQARTLLIRAGMLKPTRSSWGGLYTQIKRSNRFRKIGPGEFKLINQEPAFSHVALPGDQNR